ncbi:mannose-1-phosphate guanylyltransferase [Prochlorothrix hollandica]|uniref:mannose-1-phosphate guanylyltransferase n=1 Tax=Prochlorothrix hollandica TaxID=1223 RepID=UPI00333FCDDD
MSVKPQETGSNPDTPQGQPRITPIILAGGKGERFWPVSRRESPKQFLSLDGSGVSLLQATAQRLLGIAGGWDNLWVVTAAHLEAGVQRQLPLLPAGNLLVEPEGRDTAAAVTWATLEVAERSGEETIVGFFPADHWIDRPEQFEQTLGAAAQLAAERGAIATLGIQPTYAATGYGYIEQGEALGTFGGLPAYGVKRFTEKPDAATAAEFLASGRFSWNGGIFVFQAGTALGELRRHVPDLVSALERQGVAAYGTLPKISIDYALMEKTDRACVLPVRFGWDDLGDWNAVERLLKTEDNPNVDLGDHVALESQGCIVYNCNPDEVIMTIGLEDVVVVRDGNATLIVPKHRSQDIKQGLKLLQADPRYHHLL